MNCSSARLRRALRVGVRVHLLGCALAVGLLVAGCDDGQPKVTRFALKPGKPFAHVTLSTDFAEKAEVVRAQVGDVLYGLNWNIRDDIPANLPCMQARLNLENWQAFYWEGHSKLNADSMVGLFWYDPPGTLWFSLCAGIPSPSRYDFVFFNSCCSGTADARSHVDRLFDPKAAVGWDHRIDPTQENHARLRLFERLEAGKSVAQAASETNPTVPRPIDGSDVPQLVVWGPATGNNLVR